MHNGGRAGLRRFLEPLARQCNILFGKLAADALLAEALSRDQRAAGAAKGIEDEVRAVRQKRLNQAFNELRRELGRMLELLLVRRFPKVAPDADRIFQPLLAVETVAPFRLFPRRPSGVSW